MVKVLVGFALGVLVTLGAIYLLEEETTETLAVDTKQPDTHENSENVSQSIAAASAGEESIAAGDNMDVAAPIEINSPDGAVAIQMQTNSASTPSSQRRDTSPSTAGRNIPGEIPPEIEDMLENNVDKDLQARYESDQREDSWATYMEGQLNAYFAQKPGLAQFYFSLTDCRTSVCEIHALGYGPDALTRWNAATADLVSQPWFEFNSMSMNRRNPEPDILGIVLILTKEPS